MNEYYVYILKSLKDNSYYKGITQKLDNRLKEHNAGEQKYTASKKPWKLIWNSKKPNKTEAFLHDKKKMRTKSDSHFILSLISITA